MESPLQKLCSAQVVFSCVLTLATMNLHGQDTWRVLNTMPDNFSVRDLRDIAHGDGTWLAAGVNGTVIVSEDGETWEKKPTFLIGGFAALVDGVRYFEGNFQAFVNGSIYQSEDFENWTWVGSTGVFTARNYRTVNNIYFLGGEGNFGISADGTAWTNPLNGADFLDLAYGNETYVLVGRQSGKGILYTSSDGTEWTQQIAVADDQELFYSVDFGDGAFVLAGNNGVVGRSTNGVDWEFETVRENRTLLSVRHILGSWVISGTNVTVLHSDDGISWEDAAVTAESGSTGSQYFPIREIDGDGFIPGRQGLILTTRSRPPGNPETGERFFIGEQVSGGDFPLFSSWFGQYDLEHYPWIRHRHLRYVYIVPQGTDSTQGFFLYGLRNIGDDPMGWLWTAQGIYPYVYSYARNAWLFHRREVTVDQSISWYYQFNSEGEGIWLSGE